MKDTLKKLEDIAEKLEGINSQMNDEERVWAEELSDRKRLSLEGAAAIEHYNKWMDQHGMRHLKVPCNPGTEVNANAWGAFLEMRDFAARHGLQDVSIEEINEIIREARYESGSDFAHDQAVINFGSVGGSTFSDFGYGCHLFFKSKSKHRALKYIPELYPSFGKL